MELYKFFPTVFFTYFCMHALVLHSCLGLRPRGNETDQLALLEFKASITNDPFGVMTSWNKTIHFCHWYGVSCGRRHQRVTRLDLRSSKLSGSISPHVGNLSFLRRIHLHNNSFSNQIPPDFGRLRRLQHLLLQNNSLSGEIPSNLSRCSQLLRISLAFNILVGKIPKELGTLSKLTDFAFHDNQLTGNFPNSFSNISSLEIISATNNKLYGSIPDIFGHMTNLTFLSFDANDLSGTIPPSIFNLSSITTFGVTLNKIQGTLPSNLGIAFPSLEYFSVGCNQFSGPIPVSISNASNLYHLDMGGNKLHGNVPSLENLPRLVRIDLSGSNLGSGGDGDLSFLCDLTNATGLERVEIQTNNLGGALPQCIANLSSSLLQFHASGNKLVGSIPNGFGYLVNLESFWLSANRLSGHIPPDVGKLHNLYQLNMGLNSLSGNVPSSFGNLSQLTILYLHENNLQGNIPLSTLAECENLRMLSLRVNNFSGVMSPEVISRLSSSFSVLDLSENHLTGFLPKEIGHFLNLEAFHISNNMLFGEIPPNLGSCTKLEFLDMAGNFFQGDIPSSLGSLRGLIRLSLSHNNLSGTIPEFLELFEFMQSLNLSYNNFEGMLPMEGIFSNASAISVEGNSKLCGGIPDLHLPECKLQRSKKGGLSLTVKWVISLIFGLLGITFAILFWYLCSVRRERKEHTSSDSEEFLRLSYRSLLNATNGFSISNFIGMGSFGSVYKGVLEQGETVAIKVINLVHRGASKSFIAECEAFRNIRHRNLLKVLSVCSGIDYRGCEFKALVYEFMVNGSLEEWLHPTETIGENIERPRSLIFPQRLSIAIDVDVALDYLHHHCETPIVHCDLKPSNVLLNDDMVGHVGDFGLIKFLRKTTQSRDGNYSSSVGVKGTIGYAPPEYGIGHEVSTRGDMYSYGIMLLEMFTGKRPTDEMFQGTLNLHNFVKAASPEQMVEIVDPLLAYEGVEESLIAILAIGVACSAESPRERLDISEVITKMCRIRNKLQENSIGE
ncbi:probable LRR receptor-like serine/threonine-protein kinase At3g47570 [Malus domestica]|uniref:probable LRR receptor-like serine/threonine-protein kinase At3g47570 n=1 Tax=Malus domestica TaxID=3750 RepID=UPI0010AB024A|nr:probable LRR receptor-like serine/threonine-protein kinase At3g47570 [Malus domestica]